jgi:hypothetical protein
MMIPPAVFSSAAAGITITLSCSGVMFNFFAELFAIVYLFN